MLKNVPGDITTDETEIMKSWKEYTNVLYIKYINNQENFSKIGFTGKPSIMEDRSHIGAEVIAKRTALENDNIAPELLQVLMNVPTHLENHLIYVNL